jgi:hypothetical protein
MLPVNCIISWNMKATFPWLFCDDKIFCPVNIWRQPAMSKNLQFHGCAKHTDQVNNGVVNLEYCSTLHWHGNNTRMRVSARGWGADYEPYFLCERALTSSFPLTSNYPTTQPLTWPFLLLWRNCNPWQWKIWLTLWLGSWADHEPYFLLTGINYYE